MKTTKEQIIEYLEKEKVEYIFYSHPKVETMEDCLAVEEKIGTIVFKNLFLQNRQGTEYFLLLMMGHKKFVTSKVSKALGKSRLSFGNKEKLKELLGVEPGAITPLGLIFDKKNVVNIVIDEEIYAYEWVGVHPGVNNAMIKMRFSDLLKMIEKEGYAISKIKIEE